MPVQPVYVVCDKCGKPMPSGIAADDATLADTSNTFRNNQTQRPSCGHMVLWSKAELWPESVVKEQFGPK